MAEDPIIVEPDTLTELYGRVFYGLRYNPSTGAAYFEKIEEDEIIELPQANNISVDEYQTWLSSKNIFLSHGKQQHRLILLWRLRNAAINRSW